MFVDGSANLWTHRDRIQCRADAPEARPLPLRNGGRNGGLLAALEATGCPLQVYHPDSPAFGCSECGLSIPPIFRASGHPAVIRVSLLVVLVQRLGQGACWVLGLQKRAPRIPLWPVGLAVSPPGSPALLLLSASTDHLPSTRPCVASSGMQTGKRWSDHICGKTSGRLAKCGDGDGWWARAAPGLQVDEGTGGTGAWGAWGDPQDGPPLPLQGPACI